jgi:hypothetical protein
MFHAKARSREVERTLRGYALSRETILSTEDDDAACGAFLTPRAVILT